MIPLPPPSTAAARNIIETPNEPGSGVHTHQRGMVCIMPSSHHLRQPVYVLPVYPTRIMFRAATGEGDEKGNLKLTKSEIVFRGPLIGF